MSPLRAALYLRVSTDRQETECQRAEVEQLARVRGFEVVRVFAETMSAAKVRPEYAKMMKEARRGAFPMRHAGPEATLWLASPEARELPPR
jgi:DNA invertase Pin-like site-specific DNA recombinase